jgi:D-alanyl-lipoteichoic acid acyltransferase DltB (MBOAT superfamily)
VIAIPSLAFLGFTAAVAALYYAGRGPFWRRCIFALANIVFLAGFARAPAAFVPLVAFLLFGYCAVALIQRGYARRGWAVAGFVVTVILAFVWLKKYSFVPGELWLASPYTVVGLSYIFFRILHLIVDAGQDALPERVGLLDYIGYTLNFFSLVSGPIQRYPDYAANGPATPARPDIVAAGVATERIVIGFFKVGIVSALLLQLQHQAISALTPGEPFLTRAGLGLAIVALYPLYLYANFSGYTDFVIGAARFLGLILPENFNRPFTSANFIDFWSRWHITLSSWLKTYVYNPLLLTLMRRVPSRGAEPWLAVTAFFVTFFLVGVWHGQTSEFLFFGILQGGGVAVNKLYQIEMTRRLGRKRYRALCDNVAYRVAMRGLTFTWFAFTLLWFWSNWRQMQGLVTTIGGEACAAGLAGLVLAAALALSAGTVLRAWAVEWRWRGESILLSRYTRTAWGTALAVVSVSAIVLMGMKAPDIVYQAF